MPYRKYSFKDLYWHSLKVKYLSTVVFAFILSTKFNPNRVILHLFKGHNPIV
jgi:hypothetical protein